MAEQTGETAAEAGNDGAVTQSPRVKTTVANGKNPTFTTKKPRSQAP